jgi:uncharacterized protein YdbL (DUF1318 family)
MKKIAIALICAYAVAGCATVSLKSPKDPIKVDISMRVDVYQHVKEDITNIEDIVTGQKPVEEMRDDSSMLGIFENLAHAQENLSEEIKNAALRRKERRPKIIPSMKEGIVGESGTGLLEIRDYQAADGLIEALVKAETIDRMVICQALAQENNTSIQAVQKVYAQRLQEDAPKGTPVEVESRGKYVWKIK